jgi:hypothetical protein
MDFEEGKLKLIANSMKQKGMTVEDMIQSQIHKKHQHRYTDKKGSKCFSLCVKSERERERERSGLFVF